MTRTSRCSFLTGNLIKETYTSLVIGLVRVATCYLWVSDKRSTVALRYTQLNVNNKTDDT